MVEKKNGTRLIQYDTVFTFAFFLAKFIDEIVQKRYNNSTKNGKLYSLTRILEVTENDFIEALRSSISDYEDAVVKYMIGGMLE
jgi:hypothetical protein